MFLSQSRASLSAYEDQTDKEKGRIREKKCDKVLITCTRYVLGYRQRALSTSLAAETFCSFSHVEIFMKEKRFVNMQNFQAEPTTD